MTTIDTHGPSQGPDALTRRVCEANNIVRELLHKSQAKQKAMDARSQVVEALHVSCSLLGELDSPALSASFDRAIREGDRASEQNADHRFRGALSLVRSDSHHFHEFLDLEQRLLVASGMKKTVADWIIEEIKELAPIIQENPIGREEFERAMHRLRDYICGSALQGTSQIRADRVRKPVLYCLGGTAVILVNLTAASLSQIGAGASAAIGGGLVLKGVDSIIEK